MASRKQWWLSLVMVILLVGCWSAKQDDSSVSISEDILQTENIEDYLAVNIGISAFGGKVFCVYEPLNAQQGVDGKIYLWVMCQEYYPEQESLIHGSGVSLPIVILIQDKNGHNEIVDHLVPRDGTYYGSDVRTAFPQSAWSQIMSQSEDERSNYNYRASKLAKDTETEARSYYDASTP